MKKIICTLLAAMVLLTVSACSGKENTAKSPDNTGASSQTEQSSDAVSSESSPSSDSNVSLPAVEEAAFNSDKDYSGTITSKFLDVSKLSDKTKSCVVDVLNGDKLTVNAEGKISIAKGITMDFTAAICKDGTNSSFNMNIAGQGINIIRNDKGTYLLDDENKTATLTKNDASDTNESAFYSNPAANKVVSFIAGIFGSDPITYVKSGAEVFEGEAMSYEEYAVGKTSIKLYYNGSTIKYPVIDKDGAVSSVKVNTLTASADPKSFTVPEEYTVKDK